VHDSTFGEDERERAAETGIRRLHKRGDRARGGRSPAGPHAHQPALQPRRPELLAEAKAVFPESIIARDGLTIDVPFSE